MKLVITITLFVSLIACSNSSKKVLETTELNSSVPMSKAEEIISKAIIAHGGEKYDQAHYSFVFRKKGYIFHNQGETFTYLMTSNKDDITRLDRLDNSGFSRRENGQELELSEKDRTRFGDGLNSVIYFATLPHKLQDKAVIKKYIGTTTIKSKAYEVIEVRFHEEGGGTDHDDTFYYWVGTEDDHIDYLAYNYQVNKGGVRFRTAYNRRNVDGIVFQDYINYKAEVGTPLGDLPSLWEDGKLKELSRIETEDVQRL